eukprot:436282_1
MEIVAHTDPWIVVQTVSGVLFGSTFEVDINNIQKAFESTTNGTITDVLDNLDRGVARYKWQENDKQNKTILYQLLLIVFKDNNTNISNILQDFISVAPNPTPALRTFNECTLREMVYILTTQVFNALSSDLITPYIQNK